MAVLEQVHYKFKVFTGASVEELDSQVRAYTSSAAAAAKSIGVEYVESRKTLVLSLGYRDDEPGYAVRLFSHSAGNLDFDSAGSLAALESSLETVAASAGNVICHELYVTETGQVQAVFLTHA